MHSCPHRRRHRVPAAAPACALATAAAARSSALRVVSKQTEAPNKASEDSKDSAVRQMMGMKGAALETDKFKIRVQLTKPVTWIPLIWGGWPGWETQGGVPGGWGGCGLWLWGRPQLLGCGSFGGKGWRRAPVVPCPLGPLVLIVG